MPEQTDQPIEQQATEPMWAEELQAQTAMEREERAALQSIIDGPKYDAFEHSAAFLLPRLFDRIQELEHNLESNVIATQRLEQWRLTQRVQAIPPAVAADTREAGGSNCIQGIVQGIAVHTRTSTRRRLAEKYLAEYGGPRCTSICPPSIHNEGVAHQCLLHQGHEGPHVHSCVLQEIHAQATALTQKTYEMRQSLALDIHHYATTVENLLDSILQRGD